MVIDKSASVKSTKYEGVLTDIISHLLFVKRTNEITGLKRLADSIPKCQSLVKVKEGSSTLVLYNDDVEVWIK